jgi:hypothetical protein
MATPQKRIGGIIPKRAAEGEQDLPQNFIGSLVTNSEQEQTPVQSGDSTQTTLKQLAFRVYFPGVHIL